MPAFAPEDRDDVDADDVGADVGGEVDKAVEPGDADIEVDEIADAVVLGGDVLDACHLISIPYALRFARPIAVESDVDEVNIYVLVADP